MNYYITGKDVSNVPIMKTINECKELTNLSYQYLRSLIRNKKIKYIKAGNRYYINFHSLASFLENDE